MGRRTRLRAFSGAGCEFDLAVVVAMFPMRMVQMSADQIIGMVAMEHLLMTAGRSIDMVGLVGSALVIGSAAVCVRFAYLQLVLIHLIAVKMMKMTVVNIIGVTLMLNGGVSAIRTMRMGVFFLFHTSCLWIDDVPGHRECQF